MTLFRRTLSRFWILAAIPSLSAGAQVDQAPIPREFVVAALRSYGDRMGGMGSPTLVVGSVPSSLAGKIAAPPGGRVIGSVVWQGQTDVIGEAPGRVDSVLTWFGRDFAARGYRPVDSRNGWDMGGFRSAPTGPATNFCDGAARYEIQVRGAPANAFLSEFQIHVDGGQGNCAGGMVDPRSMAPEAAGPHLFNPPTAQVSGRCLGSAFRGFGGLSPQTAFVTSAMPSQLLQHYARQLDSIGWKRDNTAIPATGAWTKTDSTGDKLQAVLKVVQGTGINADCRTVSLEITNLGH